jgi:small lipoprotein (TIGR04454 family)
MLPRGLRLLALATTGWLAACGHPATEAECEEIVERVARLELEKKAPGDQQAIDAEIEATKQSVRENMLKQCVGRRITAKAMQCVRSAKTSKEVVEECFD